MSTAIVFLCISVPYLIATKKVENWSLLQWVFWLLGAICVSFAITGPLMHHAHHHFFSHMVIHLLLGMAAPLFFVLAKPATLFLRALPTFIARRVTKFMRSKVIQFICHPVTAGILNIGGLWLLYTTDLWTLMQTSAVAHFVIHLHVFLAGYLFIYVILHVDFMPHRASWTMRVGTLIVAIAGHNILAKWLYATFPQGESGALLMYYGGGVIEIGLIIILCMEWYRMKDPVQETQTN